MNSVMDEVERQRGYKAVSFAGAVLMVVYPTWFLLWKGGPGHDRDLRTSRGPSGSAAGGRGMFAVQAILFLSWQALFFTGPAEAPMRDGRRGQALRLVRLGAGAAADARHRRRPAQRTQGCAALLNDELTRHNRTQAYVDGLLGGGGSVHRPLRHRDVRAGERPRGDPHHPLRRHSAAALLTFALRERRSAAVG